MLKLLSFLPASWACSYVEIPWEDSRGISYLIPRTMELNNVFDSTNYSIEAVPLGSENKFGYLAPMNIFHLPPTGLELKIPFEGMNEVGLTVSGLLLTESIYERPEPGKKHLSAEDVIPALLANCSSVDGAIEMLESVNVVAPSLQALDGEGLHWAIADATGRSIIVEYLQGKRMILENHPRVMTNDPDIKWHWRNLNTHVNLSPNYPVENDPLQVKVDDDIGIVPRPVGHGWNLFGLPGDSSPPSRFIRLFYLRGYAMTTNPPKSFDDAAVLGTALLNNVFIPLGTVAADPKKKSDGPELTDYAVLKSAQDRVMLIRGYRNSQWRKIDLKRLDFSQARTWPLEDGSLGIQDITDAGASSVPGRALDSVVV